jgi:peptidoglycan/LPS O-acetylase OafA/YrhL
VQILAGSQLIAQQVDQPSGPEGDEPYTGPPVPLGPAGPDAQAQKASDAARPWASATILILVIGAVLMLRPRRRWRLAAIAVSVAAFAALIALVAALGAAPGNVEPDKGLLLALLVLVLTVVWQGGALVVLTFRSANRSNRSGFEKRPP